MGPGREGYAAMSDGQETRLRVEEAHERDEGRRIARIDEAVMRSLDLTSGDQVEVEGEETIVVTALQGYADDAEDVVRIDEVARSVAGVELGEEVEVRRKAKRDTGPEEAIEVAVAPTEPTPFSAPDYIKELLMGTPVESGRRFSIDSRGHQVTFEIVETKPEGRVLPNERTIVIQRDEPVEE